MALKNLNGSYQRVLEEGDWTTMGYLWQSLRRGKRSSLVLLCFATVSLLLIGVATAISYRFCDSIFGRARYAFFEVRSDRGNFYTIVEMNSWPTSHYEALWWRSPAGEFPRYSRAFGASSKHISFPGLEFSFGATDPRIVRGNTSSKFFFLSISEYWIASCFIVAMGLLLSGYLRRASELRRKAEGLCPRCGYDLRASEIRCPECGAEFRR